MKSNNIVRTSAVALLVVSLGVAALVLPDWTKPQACRRVGDRVIC
ncbi:hypothetical protein Q4F19_03015 [Sphingomonas sp. BIUV-7]|uniref:Uncharacterized protein n=1 Tax=Sphingomonas natans TaxID=3063330 RepID=A0ABT8Y4V7_9SPHN|nr:hypothetical protein [Sphingomonas sp. BIUV-7]MDO6413343.1 hypothetical protein [Sphingomonas sp. BIUV-7]